jgi:hypothetical protein
VPGPKQHGSTSWGRLPAAAGRGRRGRGQAVRAHEVGPTTLVRERAHAKHLDKISARRRFESRSWWCIATNWLAPSRGVDDPYAAL